MASRGLEGPVGGLWRSTIVLYLSTTYYVATSNTVLMIAPSSASVTAPVMATTAVPPYYPVSQPSMLSPVGTVENTYMSTPTSMPNALERVLL